MRYDRKPAVIMLTGIRFVGWLMPMRPRVIGLISTLVLGLLSGPLPAEAQQVGKVYRIGYLGARSASPTEIAFRQGLRELGYVEGQNLVSEYRWAEGKYERLPDLAAELVRLKVDVIVTSSAQPVIRAVHADGIVASVDTRAIGTAIIELGGGRRKVGEQLDLAVGFSNIAPVGVVVDGERPLAVIHAASETDADRAAECLLGACEFGNSAPAATPVVVEILAA